MTNAFGVVLDSASLRWAAAEGVPETVIAAVLLLDERSVDEIASKLRPGQLEQVIKIVGRSPSCCPPGTLEALKGRRQTPAPVPVASPPTKVATARLKPSTEDMRRAQEHRLAGLRVPARQTVSEHERAVFSEHECAVTPRRAVTPPKTGTLPGTLAETARRRLIVEDLMKAGLSVRMISGATSIPRSSVHRAMRAVARADAKREVAIVEITKDLLGKSLSHRSRGRP
jgi:hypothetical protein